MLFFFFLRALSLRRRPAHARSCTHWWTTSCRCSSPSSESPVLAQAPGARAQLYPLVDYILPVFPSVNCFSPQRTDSSTATPSAAFTNYVTQVTNKIKQFSLTGLVFTMQCGPRPANSLTFCAEVAHCSHACLCRRPSSMRTASRWATALQPVWRS